MAQIKNSRKSEGLCERIRNAVSPFRSRIRPQQTHESGHRLHQSSLSKMVPVEFNHLSAKDSKKLVVSSPAVQSAGKENSASVNKVQEFDDREILVVRGQRFTSGKYEASAPEKGEKIAPMGHPSHARFGKTKSYMDDEWIHEGRFSDYINKVKNRLMKSTSNVGGVERSISFK